MVKMSLPLIILFVFLSLIMINHLQAASPKTWCVAKMTATTAQLQENIILGCKEVDCTPIRPGGYCFNPYTLLNHASFAMNAYYQSHNRTQEACSFKNTGVFTMIDPSFGTCKYGA
ncbi:hypothetical protein CARUB_v10003588mg [Capsella rubella]|uniref:X8 domain-containing protein n=1 Tax=Capsella rubella TaxID=81985 RepID=R0HCU6_9BRAS|nr:glucan endo-1,3-beta-glucosidase [Capsella rubella]EOA22860.1 hypothetical protein CARUB_v10003588mg [Capsella rubella]